MYTEAEARDYAEGCAERWLTAMALPHPLTRAQWEAVNPPDLLLVPGPFWNAVLEVFTARCGMRPDEADILHWAWYRCWFLPPRTWLERLEGDLREYDAILAETADLDDLTDLAPDDEEEAPHAD
jgi:hypothetical protein